MKKIIILIQILTALTYFGQQLTTNDLRMLRGLSCESYHNGYFKYVGKHSDVIIYRENDYQIEYNTKNDEWVSIKMNWTENCKYSFTYFNTNMIKLKQYIGDTIDVEIIATDTIGYVYHSKYKKGGKAFDGKIVFLNDELSNSEKKKIKKKFESSKS